MSKVKKIDMIADGISKWLWLHRGNLLFCKSVKGKLWLFIVDSKFDGKVEHILITILKEEKEKVIIPSLRDLNKLLDNRYKAGTSE